MNTRRGARTACLFALCLILSSTGAARAQEESPTDASQRRVVAWTNPILLVFTWYTGEAEIRLRENHTIGFSGSFVEFEDGEPSDLFYEKNEYFSVSAFYRYYPTAAFKGFFLGVQVGNTQVDHTDIAESNSGDAFSAGVLIGYGWILGKEQRVAVSLGVGANRLFGGDVDDDVNLTLPVVRLINVGVAF